MNPKDKTSSPTRTLISPDLQEQRDYTRRMDEEGIDYTLVVGEAFIKSIRDLGYKSTATAIDELIDNAIQAEATRVDVVLGFPSKDGAKPDKLAVVDDGHGMDDKMIRRAVMWGGGHRTNAKGGFGKYGFGLPSASVSQGCSFTVYSKTSDGTVHKVNIDLDNVKQYVVDGTLRVPEPEPAEIPTWLRGIIAERFPGFPDGATHGTIVVIEKLDRLTWKTATNLKVHLLQHFGLVYRNYLGRVLSLRVEGNIVEPIDPLFITEGFRFYDIDADRAEPLPPTDISIKDDSDRTELGRVRVRYSYMPQKFAAKDKTRDATEHNKNPRFDIMKEHNGLIMCREGRQIDVINRIPRDKWARLTTFVNYDRYWATEIDFDSTLDAEFGITTAKQQVTISDRMWDILEREGVKRSILSLRAKVREDIVEREAEKDQPAPDQPRPSEKAMQEAQRFKRPSPTAAERAKKGEENLLQAAEQDAREKHIPLLEAEESHRRRASGKRYEVRTENLPGAPFYRPEQYGGQTILWLNMAHRFYTQVYGRPDVKPAERASLEVVLFSVGEPELDATNPDQRQFYVMMRRAWSEELDNALSQLEHITSVEDRVDSHVGDADDAEVAGNVAGDELPLLATADPAS